MWLRAVQCKFKNYQHFPPEALLPAQPGAVILSHPYKASPHNCPGVFDHAVIPKACYNATGDWATALGGMASPLWARGSQVEGIWCQLLHVMMQRAVQRALKDIIRLVGNGARMSVGRRRECTLLLYNTL